jgi:hypothetical protein
LFSRGSGPRDFVGFLTGWAILLDYLRLPALLSVFAAAAMVSIFPATYAWMWIIVFVVIAAAINLLGIKLTSMMNRVPRHSAHRARHFHRRRAGCAGPWHRRVVLDAALWDCAVRASRRNLVVGVFPLNESKLTQ